LQLCRKILDVLLIEGEFGFTLAFGKSPPIELLLALQLVLVVLNYGQYLHLDFGRESGTYGMGEIFLFVLL
jgi:hypothetical protein